MKVTKNIDEFVKDLINGKVVCFKTDTIWGLSANPNNKDALENLYKIKNGNIDKPFIFLIKENENIKTYIKTLNFNEIEITKKVWPGPVSIIFEYNKTSNLLNFYNTKETIALRMPKNKLCQKNFKLTSLPFAFNIC